MRFTELDWFTTTSPAFARHGELVMQAFHQAGHMFTPAPDGFTNQLVDLLCQHGLIDVQTRTCPLEYRYGTPAWLRLCENFQLGIQTGAPFMRKWTQLPDDYQALCQRALSEMHQSDFVATTHLLTAWGTSLRLSHERPGNQP